MIARVISDNGYKLELIRPIIETAVGLGSLVEVNVVEYSGDLRKIFDTQLDEDTQKRLFEQLKKSLDKPQEEPKVSEK